MVHITINKNSIAGDKSAGKGGKWIGA
jgi:hypothetical protein